MYRKNIKGFTTVVIESMSDLRFTPIQEMIGLQRLYEKDVDKVKIQKIEKNVSYNILKTVPCLIIKDLKKNKTKLVKTLEFNHPLGVSPECIDYSLGFTIEIGRNEHLDATEEALKNLENVCLLVIINKPNKKKVKENKETMNHFDHVVVDLSNVMNVPESNSNKIEYMGNNEHTTTAVLAKTEDLEKSVEELKDISSDNSKQVAVADQNSDDKYKIELGCPDGEKLVCWVESTNDHTDTEYFLQRKNGLPNYIRYYSNGNVKSESWLLSDDYDESLLYAKRENGGPNHICYYEDGGVKSEEWIDENCTNEQFRRENDLPSRICFYKNGAVKKLEWIDEDDYAQRFDDQPNYIEYHENGYIKSERWLEPYVSLSFDKLPRVYAKRKYDYPNCIEYTAKAKYEKWLETDEEYMDRGIDKPNKITRYINGDIQKVIVMKSSKDSIKIEYDDDNE